MKKNRMKYQLKMCICPLHGIFLVEFMDLNLYLPYFNGPNNGNYEIGMYFLSTFPLGVKKFLNTKRKS